MPGEWLHALACLGEKSWAFPASFESPNTVFSHAWCSTYSSICGLALPFFYLSCFSNIQWSLTSGSLQCPAWDGSQPHLWNCWQTDITPNQAEVRPKRAHFFQHLLLIHPTQKRNHTQTCIGCLKGTTSNRAHIWPEGLGKNQGMFHASYWGRGTKMKDVGMGKMVCGWDGNYGGWWLLGKPSTWTRNSKKTPPPHTQTGFWKHIWDIVR